jgi:6-phosphogluconolactonase
MVFREGVSRRTVLGMLAGGAALISPLGRLGDVGAAGAMYAYVGTYTPPSGKAEGIYVYRFDAATGALTKIQTVPTPSPSFLALDPSRRWLYAVNEIDNYGGRPSGAVSAFAINPATGNLTPLNTQPSYGTYPAHLTVDPSGQYVLAANYGSGNLSVYPIQKDGSLGAATDLVQNYGAGPNAARQEAAHAHMIAFDTAGKYAALVDLGLDKTLIYQLNTASGKLVPHDVVSPLGGPPIQSVAGAAPGAGPRHIAFAANGRFAYVINELASTITAYAYNADNGTMQEVQTISTLPAGFTGQSTTAEVVIHPNGRFLYGSNRGHDSIAIFAIDPASGRLSPIGYEPTQGKTPRNFAIDPSGTYLYAANQATDTIVQFRIDPSSGKLTATGQITQVPTPVCIVFL